MPDPRTVPTAFVIAKALFSFGRAALRNPAGFGQEGGSGQEGSANSGQSAGGKRESASGNGGHLSQDASPTASMRSLPGSIASSNTRPNNRRAAPS